MFLQVNNTEKINNFLLYHQKSRTWVEIDKSAIMYNLNQFKSIIGPKIELAIVAKSNAYGHGLISMAKICQESLDVNWLCVFSLSDAIIAREIGYKKNILVLGCVDIDIEAIITYSIDVIAYDIDFIAQLNEAAKKLKKTAYIHIKIDTGLSRFGILPEGVIELIKMINCLSFVKFRGIFSHFSESDSNDQAFTYKQLLRFNELLEKLKSLDIKFDYVHSSNTAGVIRFDNCYFNFIRIGGGSYGLYKSAAIDELARKKYQINLKLAITWKSRIVQLRDLPVGTYVSYARTFITYRPTRIAIIPVGYFDGYNRQLSNKGVVFIKGQPGFVIGRVCMNVIIVDVTDAKNIKVGDEVVLMGNMPGAKPDDIAQLTGSINYEVTTRINPMIPRIIV